jgi:hypothetical protein
MHCYPWLCRFALSARNDECVSYQDPWCLMTENTLGAHVQVRLEGGPLVSDEGAGALIEEFVNGLLQSYEAHAVDGLKLRPVVEPRERDGEPSLFAGRHTALQYIELCART